MTTTPAHAEAAGPAAANTEETRKAHQALRELDRFLDHHPLLEDDLRLAPALIARPSYARTRPELRDFLAANPTVAPTLAHEPRHLLHRALMLQASAPLRWAEITQLDPLFDQHPGLEHELARRPELIHDAAFLRAHPPLRDYLVRHPPLGAVFLPATPADGLGAPAPIRD